MDSIGVVVTGASGKMAQEVMRAVSRDPQLDLVGVVSRRASEGMTALPEGSTTVPISPSLEALLSRCSPHVIVDFTNAEGAMSYIPLALSRGIAAVTGSTGFAEDQLQQLEQMSNANQVGVVVAPNFALGAVLMIHLSKIAAKYFDYAEIIEMHHEHKADAPSGTALATARAMAQAKSQSFQHNAATKTTLAGTRGGEWEGVAIHSVRLPGLVASQEVLFGSLGQTLTIRHDTISRESFMPGVILAVKEAVGLKRFVYGLDALLGLG